MINAQVIPSVKPKRLMLEYNLLRHRLRNCDFEVIFKHGNSCNGLETQRFDGYYYLSLQIVFLDINGLIISALYEYC